MLPNSFPIHQIRCRYLSELNYRALALYVHGHGIVCYKRYGSYCAKDLEFTVSFSSCCCSPGTDIKLWAADSGKCIGMVDTNQLKNTMAALSPNGRFLAAAAFTADVKVWNGSVHSLPSVWVLFLVILLCAGDHWIMCCTQVIIKFVQLQIWEVVYGKDNQVKEVVKVMQLKGHKVSCFLELKCCLCLLLDRVTLLLLAVSMGLTLLLHGSYRKWHKERPI